MTMPCPVVSDSRTDDDDLDHIVCDCDDTKTLCGKSRPADKPIKDPGTYLPHPCVVCTELEYLPCPTCGY